MESHKKVEEEKEESNNERSIHIINKKLKNNLGKTVALGTAILMTSTGELKPPNNPDSFNGLKERAKIELETNGITSEQRKAYKSYVTDKIYQKIGPMAVTPNGVEEWKKVLGGRDFNGSWGQFENNPGEEDAWRLFLGLPQQYDTFGVSDFKPSNSKEEKYYYKIKTMRELMFKEWYENNTEGKNLKEIEVERMKIIVAAMPQENMLYDMTTIIASSKIMGHFQGSRGHDEKGAYISYYDIYDFKVPGSNLVGKPFEIYDRIYYNPLTFEILK